MDKKKILVIGDDNETRFMKDVLQNKHDVIICGGASGAGRTYALQKAMESAKKQGIKIIEFKPGENQFDSGSEFVFNDCSKLLNPMPELKQCDFVIPQVKEIISEKTISDKQAAELKLRIHRKSQSIQKQFKEIKRTGNSNITPKKKKRK